MPGKRNKEKERPLQLNEEDKGTDIMSMLSMVCGMLAMMLKYKYFSWIGVVFSLSAVFNKRRQGEWMNILTTSFLCMLGLFMSCTLL